MWAYTYLKNLTEIFLYIYKRMAKEYISSIKKLTPNGSRLRITGQRGKYDLHFLGQGLTWNEPSPLGAKANQTPLSQGYCLFRLVSESQSGVRPPLWCTGFPSTLPSEIPKDVGVFSIQFCFPLVHFIVKLWNQDSVLYIRYDHVSAKAPIYDIFVVCEDFVGE